MVDSIKSVGTDDYWSDNNYGINEKYDLNNDGKIDIQDYNLACLYIQDDDPENDIDINKEELDKIFSEVIKSDNSDENDNSSNIDASETIKEELNGAEIDPSNATTLKELQEIGARLTNYIKKCANLTSQLNSQLEELETEYNEKIEEKNALENQYNSKANEVEADKNTLEENITKTLTFSEQNAEQTKANANNTIANCIDKYLNGEYEENENLGTIIATELAKNPNIGTSKLQSMMEANEAEGALINNACKDLEVISGALTSKIRECNSLTTQMNNIKSQKAVIADCSQTASENYQKGYDKRQELRDAIVAKYAASASTEGDIRSSSNPQVQNLEKFLNSSDINNMTYADMMYVLKNAFDGCGIEYTNGNISIPKGHDGAAKNTFTKLVSLISSKSQKAASSDSTETTDTTTSENGETLPIGYEDDEDESGNEISRNDPIGFTNGNMKYEFIQDRDNDGTFDNASEFLGAKNGWQELKNYDKDGNGIIENDELKDLKMLGINSDNGQYTFTSASEAGVTSIDLSTYDKNNSELVSGDILKGTFEVNVNGKTLTGSHTLDTDRNLQNKYSTMYGAKIEDLSDDYKQNPFLADFEEKVNAKEVANKANSDIVATQSSINNKNKSVKNNITQKAAILSETAEYEKSKQEKSQANAETTENAQNSLSDTDTTKNNELIKKNIFS